MMNTSLIRIMLVSISLCWLLSAKVHLDDQVDPSTADKIAIEQAAETATEEKIHEKHHTNECEEHTEKKIRVSDARRDLTPGEIAIKEAYYLENPIENSQAESIQALPNNETLNVRGLSAEEYIQAVAADKASIAKENAVSYERYLEGLNAKEQATSLEYNLNPVSNKAGTIVTNPQNGEKIIFNSDQEKIDYYNQLHVEHAAGFNGPELPSVVNDPVYTGENGRVYRKAAIEASRDGDVSATVCGDSWAYETYWILLDTTNWWAWGSDGWVNHTAGNNACEDWSATVPAGNYLFILADSYGDGGGTADISVNGEYVGSVACASGDALSPYSGLYEASFGFDVTDPEAPCFDTDNGATDAYGDGCDGYTLYPSWCNGYDDDDFVSADMCCACGGGTSEAPATAVTFDLDGLGDCGFVSVTGTFDGWSGWGAHTDNGMTATVPAGDHEFVILCVDTASNAEWYNDIWGNSTIYNAPIDGECWNGNYDYANYTLTTAGEASMTVSYCAGSCDAECAAACDGNVVNLEVGGGSYDSEISWDLSDGSSGVAGSFEFCLADGCYTFNGYDSWGDGWNGASATFTDDAGNVLGDLAVVGSSGSVDIAVGAGECAPPTCDDEAACNTGEEGDCTYADAGYNCDGSCADGYTNDCSGACVNAATAAAYQGDGYCDDGSWGYELQCCEFNFDDGDCGASMGCDGVAIDCGGAVADDCGECGGDNSSCADCAGTPNGDSFVDCAGSCLAGSYLSWIGDGYCDDGSWGADFVSCGDFNCDNGDCGTELIGGECQSSGCSDSEFTCANGDCIPAGYYCDGSSEWGNAGWGPDCSDGSDELFDECCAAGLYADDLCNPAPDCSDITLVVGGGSWDSEITWDLSDGSSGAAGTFALCLEDGDYTFNGYDAYGDGWNGGTATFSDVDGNVIAQVGGDFTTGSSFSATVTIGGAPPVAGCTDPGAPNYNADAEVDDGSCEDYCGGANDCAYWLGMGYTCEELVGYGYDCSACEADGSCDAGFECQDGSVADTPEDCEGCAYDWSPYGAESCDAAWDAFGIDCATLEGTYGWDCLGCECPGDAADTGGDDDPWCYGDGIENDYVLFVGGGSYDSEISFQLNDATGAIIAEGNTTANHPDAMDNGGIFLCMEDGGYTMLGYDSWGDGWNGAGWNLFNANTGEWQEGGQLLMNSDYADWDFCLGAEDGEGVCADYGCTLSASDNFDPDATIDTGSCTWYAGMECQYWWSGASDGFVLGCGVTYEHCWNTAAIGDGECDHHWAGDVSQDPGANHGLACLEFDCDGGDCSDCEGGCADDCEDYPADECPWPAADYNGSDEGCGELEACEGLTVDMYDSYGDSWNGNVLTIGTVEFSITEYAGYAQGCYNGPMDVVVTCDGGSYQSEVSWDISDADGNVLLSGGAPYSGCLGTCDDVAFGCTDETACNYDADAESDDGSCTYPDCTGDCEGTAVVDDCGECGGDGSACAGCAYPQWFADGYCDSSNNTPECNYDGGDCCPGDCVDNTYSCETYGGDCTDCIDPDSADNAPGGQCAEYSGGCTDPYADNYDPDATEDDGTCLYDGCAAGYVAGCSEQDIADGECATEGWVGDGYCDGAAEQYGINLCCYDNDGGDCSDAECADITWESDITGLTATGVDYYGYSAIAWDWDDAHDGEDAPSEATCGDLWDSCLAFLEFYDADLAAECNDCGEGCTGELLDGLTDECSAIVAFVFTGLCGDPCADGGDGGADDGGDDGGDNLCEDGNPPLVDCVGTEFCNEDCANTSYDGCVDGETTWIGDGYCDDGSWGMVYACAEYDCDGCDCADGVNDFSTDGCTADCTAPDNSACAESFTITWGMDFDGDGYADECYDDGYGNTSGYLSFNWDGNCLVTSVAGAGYDQDGPCDEETGLGCDFAAGDPEDFSSYGFNSGFYWYGWESNYTDYWTVTFTDVSASSEATTGDCDPEPTTECDENQFDCLGDGTECIPASYFCDGSSEFCNASWPADCSNGADEGLDICDYLDECEEEPESNCADGTPEGSGDCDCHADCADGQYCYGVAGSYGYCWDEADCCYYDDAIDGECPGGCDGRTVASNDVPALSTDKNTNLKLRAKAINAYKHAQVGNAPVDKVFNRETTDKTIAFVNQNGEITYIANGPTEDRVILGYDVYVSCDSCLSGGPWAGNFGTGGLDSELTVFGFDDGSVACGSVTAISTLYGAGTQSDPACAEAGLDEGCQFFDCSGQEACGYEGWVGDGFCDDGAWGYFFDCEEFDCDAGDCEVACWDGSVACGAANCPEEPSCTAGDVNGDEDVNVQDIVVMVGYILDGSSADVVEECGDANGDGSVNVQDIVVLVNVILGGRTTSDATEADLRISNGTASLDANGFVGAVQMTLSHGAGFSIELTDKAMVADYRTNANSTTLIIVAPESDELFTASGDFSVENIIVANENSQVTVGMPTELTLSKAYPNPFNPSTSMSVYVPADGVVSLSVYNVMGQEVATLHSGNMTAGNHTVTWNASNMTTGMYFVRAESSNGVAVQKVMLMK